MLKDVKARTVALGRSAIENVGIAFRRRALVGSGTRLSGSLAGFLTVCLALAALAGCRDGTTITTCGYGCSSGTATAQAPISTTTTITASPVAVTYGSKVNLTATVTPATSGVVGFTDGTFSDGESEDFVGQVLAHSGVATDSLSGLGVGTHYLLATYTSDSTYLSSTSNPGALVTVSAPGANCGLDTGTYVLTSGTASLLGGSYSAPTGNASAVCAASYGTSLTFSNSTISTSASVEYVEDDINGLGAAVLAYGSSASTNSGASITISGGSIAETGEGVSAVFASGLGSSVEVTGATISAFANYYRPNNLPPTDHVAAAARGGVVALNNVSGTNTVYSGPLFSVDGDGSSITVDGGNFVANSYAGTARIEGNGSMTLKNANITGNAGFASVLFSNDSTDGSSPGSGSFAMAGGSFAMAVNSDDAYTFLVWGGANATISLTDTNLIPAPSLPGGRPTLLGLYDTSTASLVASGTSILGSLQSVAQSTLNISLQKKAVWNGCFTIGVSISTGATSLALDSTSTWNVSGNCHVESFSDPAGISGLNLTNVIGNGYTVTYNPAKSPALGGLTYNLSGGGILTPGTQ